MRKIVFAVLVIVISASIVQAQADIGPAVVSLVRKSLKDNYRPLGTVKARLRLETKTILSVDAPSAKDARQPDKADVNTGRLQVAPANAIAPPAIQWTAELGPNTERFQVETPAGPQVFSMDDNGATVYTPAQKRAQIMPWMPERLRGQLQYDPREIGLLTLGERFEEILAGDIRSAKLVPRPEGETTAVLQAYSAVQRCQMVIECSSRFNYLPTRVYYISDAGYINGVTDITYQQVRNEPKPVWFLKSAEIRNAGLRKNKSPDDAQWDQHATLAVSELTMDVATPPIRDTAATLPAGTQVENLGTRIPR